ncbi:MAG: hypothetical protein ABIT96_11000 [Ferruginibacter sp.]
MKKNLISLSTLTALLFLFFTGCQKDTKELDEMAGIQLSTAKPENAGGCRLTMYDLYDPISDYHQIDNFTYKNGLLDEWAVSYGLVFKMEYDKTGKMKGAAVFYDDELVYTIHFIYQRNKVVKELWYLGNTQVVDDEVILTYNQKGQMIKNESLYYNYYTTYTYLAANGELDSWLFYIGGMPVQRGEYIPSLRYKNPFRAIPGLDYAFGYANSGSFFWNSWYSSEKSTFYDEFGNPTIHYDLDPAQTTWVVGSQNYPLQANYVDRLTSTTITNTFEYENCPGSVNRTSSQHGNNRTGSSLKSGTSRKILVHGPNNERIQKIIAARKKK